MRYISWTPRPLDEYDTIFHRQRNYNYVHEIILPNDVTFILFSGHYSVQIIIIIIIITVKAHNTAIASLLYALERKKRRKMLGERKGKEGCTRYSSFLLSIVIFLEKKGFQKWLKIIDRVSLFQVKWNSVPQQWPTKRKKYVPHKT